MPIRIAFPLEQEVGVREHVLVGELQGEVGNAVTIGR